LIWINAAATATAEDTVTAEDMAMSETLVSLRQDHGNTISLLRALEWQIDEFASSRQPDYDVIGATIDYFLNFPDACHHSKEELIFAKLRERNPAIVQQIGDLEAAHRELAARVRDFATALHAVLDEREVSREALAGWARRFIELQRRHIEMEEAAFLPAAATSLTAEDWTELGSLMATEDDPLFGRDVLARFEKLRKTILVWQAQDQAVLARD
jgi:hemerythrin-like domain-containing protein